MDLSAYEGGRYETKMEIVRDLTEKYHAKILFIEEVGGVTSYYCYTPAWTDGLILYGKKINLHIAIGGNQLAVGSPIIFDGF